MKWLMAILTALLLPVVAATPAQASTPTGPPSASSNPFGVPYCVSTTWRTHYWHTHKTPLHSYCFVPVDPFRDYKPAWWIPRTWIVRGYSSDDQTGEWGILVFTR